MELSSPFSSPNHLLITTCTYHYYCWWKKILHYLLRCIKIVKHLLKNHENLNYLSTGAGFLPSTVCVFFCVSQPSNVSDPGNFVPHKLHIARNVSSVWACTHSDSHYMYIVIFMHEKPLYDNWLVGGWTNPSEEFMSQNGNLPENKWTKIFETTTQLITNWWFQPLWKILVKMGSSSPSRGEHKNSLKPPPTLGPQNHEKWRF